MREFVCPMMTLLHTHIFRPFPTCPPLPKHNLDRLTITILKQGYAVWLLTTVNIFNYDYYFTITTINLFRHVKRDLVD